MKKPVRLKLLLGKLRVLRVARAPHGYTFTIEFPGLGFLSVPVPTTADVREGDVLAIYTEVLTNAPIEGPTDANAGRPSI
jgi:hypothetical protein